MKGMLRSCYERDRDVNLIFIHIFFKKKRESVWNSLPYKPGLIGLDRDIRQLNSFVNWGTYIYIHT